jgi:uncharacterized membrane protein YdbT with pleckstrin-like domain
MTTKASYISRSVAYLLTASIFRAMTMVEGSTSENSIRIHDETAQKTAIVTFHLLNLILTLQLAPLLLIIQDPVSIILSGLVVLSAVLKQATAAVFVLDHNNFLEVINPSRLIKRR